MTVQTEVEVKIRKGLGPDEITRFIPIGLDDLPEDTEKYQIREMAQQEAEIYLRRTDDYKVYGKNWRFIDVHFT